jgi:hypothetical protein
MKGEQLLEGGRGEEKHKKGVRVYVGANALQNKN